MKKNYTILQNMIYVTKSMFRHDKAWAPLMFVGALFGLVGEYAVIFLPKLIVEHVLANDAWELLLRTCLILGGILMLSHSVGDATRFHMDSRLINVRMHMVMEKMNHANCMPYQMLERPDILNLAQLAQMACDDNYGGIEGLMRRVYIIFFDVVKILFSIAILVTLSPIFIIAVVTLALIHFHFFQKNIASDKRDTWDPLAPYWRKIGYYRRVFSDFGYGKDIRLYHMNKFLKEKLVSEYREAHSYIDRSKRRWARFGVFTNLIQAILEIIVYAFLLFWFLNDRIGIADVTFYTAATFAFFRSLSGILYGMAHTKRCSLKTNDYRSFLEIPVEIESITTDFPIETIPTLRFDHVSFRYEGQTSDALHQIDLIIRPGEKVAIVGLNGAGKSTLVKLMMRLYRPTEGTITMNGIDVWTMPIHTYHQRFSPLFQDIELYAFELGENIAMRSSNKIDSNRLQKAIVDSGLAATVQTLKHGSNTKLLKTLDEDGIDLSGGERQKLAFARALYKNAAIVILDEPTASLDAMAEHELYLKFNDLIQSKTAMFISHRLSSTRFCDRILYLEDGKIVEDGSHDDLMSFNGKYKYLFDVQAKYYREGGNRDETDV